MAVRCNGTTTYVEPSQKYDSITLTQSRHCSKLCALLCLVPNLVLLVLFLHISVA